ncbi:MAG: M28 family peptidase [Sphingomonadaceae bacterium]|nr:M28 family peptidase [Sphingomonadaceae bacterium]
MKRAAGLLVLFLALLAAMALKGALLTLPSPPAQPEAGRFDANRAAARLARVLGDQRPHPADSANGDAVRDRLIAEMRGVGLEPRVSDDFACNNRRTSRVISCARVRNLVATIGPATGRHVLLVSHYDSTPVGPGAADDGIGVASMLEIAAALRGRPLARPVSFLIDEGEEVELLGARAFLARDPLAAQVDTIINLEARGVNGPAIMFETSRPNGPAVALYRAAAARPVANSLSTDLYHLIPNSTDVTVFAERPGWTMLNFSPIGNETRYHSAGDTLAALDRSSLQHMGEQALSAAETAAAGAPAAGSGERLYADLAGRVLIDMPMMFGLVLLGLVLLYLLVESWRRRAFGRPLLAVVAALLGSLALAFAGHFVIQWLRPGDYWRAYPVVTSTAVYASALAAVVAALLLIARSPERTRLRAAFWLVFTLLGALLCLIAPGGAIYFLFPPLAAALGIALKRWWPKAEQVGAILAALLLFVTFGPALGLFEDLLNGGPLWVFAPLGAAIMLPVLIEFAPFLGRGRTLYVVAGAIDLAIAGWIAAGLMPAYGDDRQQLFTIEYVADQGAGTTRFAVNNDGAPVPFDAAWTRAELPYSSRRRWVAPAPPVPITAPALTLMGQQAVPGGRHLRFRIAANGAETVSLVAPPEARLRAAGSPGFVVPFGRGSDSDKYYLRCVGRSCDGAVIDVLVGSEQPVEFTLIGGRSGLPAVAAPLVAARPALARPQYGADATITVGRVRF